MSTTDELVSIPTIANRADVDVKTVRRWIAQGDLPAYRMGEKLIRVRQSDLDAMLRPIPAAK